jgi:hypothetical protein
MSWMVVVLPMFGLYIAVSILCKLSYRISVAVGIALLLLAALSLLVADTESVAEKLAVAAFFFLCSGVIVLLADHLRAR